jgi:hypothetical protein
MGKFKTGDTVYLTSDYNKTNPYMVSHYLLSGIRTKLFETGTVACIGKKSAKAKIVKKFNFQESDLTF